MKCDHDGPGVYAIINNQNKKQYIGSSANIQRRIKQHLADLKTGRHSNKALLKDYNDGHTFRVEILIKIHCSVKEELFKKESLIMSKARRNNISLYNEVDMKYNYYCTRQTIIEGLADMYCREHLGMNLGQLFNRSEAAYTMLYKIAVDPENEDEIRKHYQPAVDYQNKENYYITKYKMSYDEFLSLPTEEQEQLKQMCQ